MAKKKGLIESISMGISLPVEATRYLMGTPQVRGRVAKALARETKGGAGKVSKRASYKRDMKRGFKQSTPQERAKIVRALARNTKGGKGRISKRPAYRKYV